MNWVNLINSSGKLFRSDLRRVNLDVQEDHEKLQTKLSKIFGDNLIEVNPYGFKTARKKEN